MTRLGIGRGGGEGSGYYKCVEDALIKNGEEISVKIPENGTKIVGEHARKFANYCWCIMRTSISFTKGGWDEIVTKYEEEMCLKVKVISGN